MVITFQEFLSHPVVVDFLSTVRFKTNKEYFLEKLYTTQQRHCLSWESEERRKQHSIDNISKIRWDANEKCFNIFYKETENFSSIWYHYDLDGRWY